MTFDPSRRVSVRVSDVERAVEEARFWFEVKLYLKVMGILALPTALALWALIEWLG